MNYYNGYGYGWRSEEQRRKYDEWREQSKEGIRRYWANITPEQREERKRKAAETRRRNLEIEAQLEGQREAEEEAKRDRYERAARTRRRNQGYPDMSTEEFKEWRKEQAAIAKEAAFGPPTPDVRRPVPGDPRYWDFVGIPRSYVAKRSEKFWPYVDQSGGPDACWPWHGARGEDYHTGAPTDYGQVGWRGGYTGAHRVAWMLGSGYFIPPGLVIDHMCGCKWCVNPDHLLCTTQGYNSLLTYQRPPEYARTRTSLDPPWDDRWYPFGRRKPREENPDPYNSTALDAEQERNIPHRTLDLPKNPARPSWLVVPEGEYARDTFLEDDEKL